MFAKDLMAPSKQAKELNIGAGSPVYIDAPTFTPNSNGIKCIYYLAKELSIKGLRIIFLPRNNRGFRKSLPSEFRGIESSPSWSISGPATLICSESVPAKTISYARANGIRIIWWYLAPHGLLENPKASPKAGEKILTFSSFIFPDGEHYYFQPPLDQPWSQALKTYRPKSNHKTLEIGLYCGKGRLKSIPTNLRKLICDSNIHIITRSSPSSRKELFSLMSTLDGLITFDELSQLTLEAATLGLPVFIANPLFPAESLDSFPVLISPLISRESGSFIRLMSSRRMGELRGIAKSSVFCQNSETVARLEQLVLDPSWSWTSSDNIKLRSIISFGHRLRSRRALYPHYAGQSSGTYLLGLYIAFLSEKPLYYNLLCRVISLVDELGRFCFLLGGGVMFSAVANKVGRSQSLRKTSRLVRRFTS